MKITSSVQSNTLGGCRNVYFNGISMLSVAAFFAGRGGFLTRLSLTINNDNFRMIPSAGAFCCRFDLKLRICSLFTRLKFALQALPISSLLWKMWNENFTILQTLPSVWLRPRWEQLQDCSFVPNLPPAADIGNRRL